MYTDRLEVRSPNEGDRARFVELFCDPDFMVFSAGVHDAASAHDRFDRMVAQAHELPFAKRAVVDRTNERVLGYVGAAWFEFEGEPRLEFGWRLEPAARGRGFATEAGLALMDVISATWTGEMLVMIDPRNTASARVADKLGFTFWRQAVVDGFLDNLYRRAWV